MFCGPPVPKKKFTVQKIVLWSSPTPAFSDSELYNVLKVFWNSIFCKWIWRYTSYGFKKKAKSSL